MSEEPGGNGMRVRGPTGNAGLNVDGRGDVEGFSAEGKLAEWDEGAAGQAYFDIGGFQDEEGGHSYGIQGGVRSFTEEAPIGDTGFYAFRQGPEASAELVFGEDQTRIGAGASTGGGGIGFRERDPNSGGDLDARLGVSEGPGAGVRFHHRDLDGDGRRETGMGVDLGFISADLVVEESDSKAIFGSGVPGLVGVRRPRRVDRAGTLARVGQNARATVDRELARVAMNEVCEPYAD